MPPFASELRIPLQIWLLDHESLDLVLESADLAHEVGGLVGGDAAADNCAAHTAGAAKGHLAGDVDLISPCQ